MKVISSDMSDDMVTIDHGGTADVTDFSNLVPEEQAVLLKACYNHRTTEDRLAYIVKHVPKWHNASREYLKSLLSNKGFIKQANAMRAQGLQQTLQNLQAKNASVAEEVLREQEGQVAVLRRELQRNQAALEGADPGSKPYATIITSIKGIKQLIDELTGLKRAQTIQEKTEDAHANINIFRRKKEIEIELVGIKDNSGGIIETKGTIANHANIDDDLLLE